MKKIHESQNVVLEVELSRNISSDNLFGKLRWTINGKNIANEEENNLSYFYTDCETLKLILEKNTEVENPLFNKENEEILSYWREWENFKLHFDTICEEPENVKFFDRNYFKTGNIFNSFFFDDIMIFYVIGNDLIKFKYWYQLNGSEIYEISVHKNELISSIDSFLRFFNTTNQDLNNR